MSQEKLKQCSCKIGGVVGGGGGGGNKVHYGQCGNGEY